MSRPPRNRELPPPTVGMSQPIGRATPLSVASWTHVVLLLAAVIGCNRPAQSSSDSADIAQTVTASATRANRRLFAGAPPTIPHPPLQIDCNQCHTDEGKPTPPVGIAPANPHRATAGIGRDANCRQCHLFQQPAKLIAENDFLGLRPANVHGERLYRSAPPVIPHPVFMREDCNACHSGPAVRPEIRCSHPQRANCRQCHAQSGRADPLDIMAED